jgi:hypothetical protein
LFEAVCDVIDDFFLFFCIVNMHHIGIDLSHP